jgi:hypothetical protein
MGFMFMVAFTGLLGLFGKDRQALPAKRACRCVDVPSHDGLACYVASRMSARHRCGLPMFAGRQVPPRTGTQDSPHRSALLLRQVVEWQRKAFNARVR